MTMIISSVELQRKLKKIVHFKVGTKELGLVPGYFRRVVSDMTAMTVINTSYPKTSINVTIKDFLENNDLDKKPYLVFNEQEELVGLISKREINKSHKKTRDITTVGDLMYDKFLTVLPTDYLYSVIQKMNSYPFDMIPVINPDDTCKVIGIISNEDILNLLVETKKP